MLLKSGESGDFQAKYIVALQDSPDVIMAHAAVSRVPSDAARRREYADCRARSRRLADADEP